MRKVSSIIVIVLIASLLLFTLLDMNLFQSSPSNSSSVDHVETNTLAPVMQLKDWNGGVRKIGGQSSTWTLLNFWASWCGPCEEEAADLVRLYNQYSNVVEFIGINATSVDNESDARAFVKKHKLNFPIVFDTAGRATEAYKLVGYPSTFLINPEGQIVANMAGTRTYKQFKQVIDRYITKGTP
jgi:cytochrome c biogenesis protein CcmG, thiol:disulfide interchange protein DsbE